MGLDVYLKKCADIAAADAAEAEYEKRTDPLWSDQSLTTEQRDEKLAVIAAELGTDKWGTHQGREGAELNSTIDPEHMFKIGYFRSSYNESGINRVLRNIGQPDLAGIMGAPEDGSNFSPDWEAALARINEVISAYEAHLAGPLGKYGVTNVRPMWEFGVKDEQAALVLFQEEIERDRGAMGGSFSSRDGDFMMSGMKVMAVITKQFTPDRSGNSIMAMLNRPSVFLIYEKEADGKPDWYLTALKIVRETCEHVIAQPDRQHYYMVWSG